MTETNLANRLKSNDKEAINLLYNQYSKRLYQFIYRYLKTEADTLDLIQEVFIKLWSNRSRLQNDSNLESYLFTIAKNSIISTFRKKISEKDYFDYIKHKAVNTNSLATEKQVDFDLLSDEIDKLIDQLPKQRQLIFKLSKEKGYSNKMIAEQLKISIKTVEDHITKARKFIRENLQEYGLLALLFLELFAY
ncbi:RNA polymerase sigma factor [Mangrovibacterium lignilyticum]|uniref:RNA polymerase sigma factor n=1 Tax=Mangrovibacterium lignilyticum TaxID=2668052 RepID=UPI0013D4E54E|nr:RNA polymerase sigma-70 factor [Mangrovibacterium lignilyticum]